MVVSLPPYGTETFQGGVRWEVGEMECGRGVQEQMWGDQAWEGARVVEETAAGSYPLLSLICQHGTARSCASDLAGTGPNSHTRLPGFSQGKSKPLVASLPLLNTADTVLVLLCQGTGPFGQDWAINFKLVILPRTIYVKHFEQKGTIYNNIKQYMLIFLALTIQCCWIRLG